MQQYYKELVGLEALILQYIAQNKMQTPTGLLFMKNTLSRIININENSDISYNGKVAKIESVIREIGIM